MPTRANSDDALLDARGRRRMAGKGFAQEAQVTGGIVRCHAAFVCERYEHVGPVELARAEFAQRLPDLIWWPSDASARHVASIEAWRTRSALPNLRPARCLDVCTARWPLDAGDDVPARDLTALVCINMIHISPWEATEGLLRLAGAALARDGLLYLYGPYRREGQHTAPSNAAFDRSLRAQDPRFGVRDAEAVVALAGEQGLAFVELVPMPANNFSLVFRSAATARAG